MKVLDRIFDFLAVVIGFILVFMTLSIGYAIFVRALNLPGLSGSSNSTNTPCFSQPSWEVRGFSQNASTFPSNWLSPDSADGARRFLSSFIA